VGLKQIEAVTRQSTSYGKQTGSLEFFFYGGTDSNEV